MFIISVEIAFNYIIEERKMKAIEKKKKLSKNEIDMMEMVLNVHTKTIARKSSVKSLRNNDPGLKKIMVTQRINLPFKVNHRALSKESDSLFFGKKFIDYPGKPIFVSKYKSS